MRARWHRCPRCGKRIPTPLECNHCGWQAIASLEHLGGARFRCTQCGQELDLSALAQAAQEGRRAAGDRIDRSLDSLLGAPPGVQARGLDLWEGVSIRNDHDPPLMCPTCHAQVGRLSDVVSAIEGAPTIEAMARWRVALDVPFLGDETFVRRLKNGSTEG